MDVRKALEEKGCLYTGHFVGTSTQHLGGYCNIDPIMPHVKLIGQFIKLIIDNFRDADIDTVAAPAIGAIPFAHWGAQHLMISSNKEIMGVWADKVSWAAEREFVFEREGF